MRIVPDIIPDEVRKFNIESYEAASEKNMKEEHFVDEKSISSASWWATLKSNQRRKGDKRKSENVQRNHRDRMKHGNETSEERKARYEKRRSKAKNKRPGRSIKLKDINALTPFTTASNTQGL